ncbi:MAG: DUF1571 domain-containing protein [Sedimentisphaerales bacterium]|nr:DUF1571 domain-containing protein [Sedimentisphaerales bacterium]
MYNLYFAVSKNRSDQRERRNSPWFAANPVQRMLVIKLAKGNTPPRLLVTLLLAVFLLQSNNYHARLVHFFHNLSLIQTSQAAPVTVPSAETKSEPNIIIATDESKTAANSNPTPTKNHSSNSPISKAGPDQAKPDYTELITELAKTDHIILLKKAQENYQLNVKNFTANFSKQERIDDKLKKEEQIYVRFLDKPFSLMMHWKKNAGAVDKLLYVEGKNDNKMLVHPTGFFSWIKSVKKDPHDKEVKKASLRSCDQFGFYRTISNLIEVYELAQKNKDLRITYLGNTKVDGRPCVAMERILPAKKQYPYARLVMEFDVEYLIPTSISCYDWQGRLLSRYAYSNLKFNLNIAERNFTPKANGL